MYILSCNFKRDDKHLFYILPSSSRGSRDTFKHPQATVCGGRFINRSDKIKYSCRFSTKITVWKQGKKRTEREKKLNIAERNIFTERYVAYEYNKMSTMDIIFNTDYHSVYYFKDQHTSKSF